jgi:hypothetical protein
MAIFKTNKGRRDSFDLVFFYGVSISEALRCPICASKYCSKSEKVDEVPSHIVSVQPKKALLIGRFNRFIQ